MWRKKTPTKFLTMWKKPNTISMSAGSSSPYHALDTSRITGKETQNKSTIPFQPSEFMVSALLFAYNIETLPIVCSGHWLPVICYACDLFSPQSKGKSAKLYKSWQKRSRWAQKHASIRNPGESRRFVLRANCDFLLLAYDEAGICLCIFWFHSLNRS